LEKYCVAINEHRWHRKGNLQPTWKKLIRLLMAFQHRRTDNESLRAYQISRWGRTNGETCVIELSGLAAHNLTISRDRDSFRQRRIELIREKIRKNRPRFVVTYNLGARKSWEKIAGCAFPYDDILATSGTILALRPQPTAPGRPSSNKYWEELGQQLRKLY
jgi:hypothetical protein